jgi:hypothetical protein
LSDVVAQATRYAADTAFHPHMQKCIGLTREFVACAALFQPELAPDDFVGQHAPLGRIAKPGFNGLPDVDPIHQIFP